MVTMVTMVTITTISSIQVLMVVVMVLTMAEDFSIITVQVTYQVFDIWPTCYSPVVSFSVG